MNYGVFVDNIIYGCDDLQIVCYNLYAYLELLLSKLIIYVLNQILYPIYQCSIVFDQMLSWIVIS